MTAAQTPGVGSNGERVFIRLGPPPEEPGQFVTDGAPQSYPADVQARLEVEAKEIIGRYPNPRSALLPLLHLVQSEDGYVTPAGVEFCGEQLGLTGAEVAAVASFYTMYRRGPTGEYLVGVCTNTLCAVMGGDATRSKSISASATTRPRRMDRSPCNTSSATPRATTHRW